MCEETLGRKKLCYITIKMKLLTNLLLQSFIINWTKYISKQYLAYLARKYENKHSFGDAFHTTTKQNIFALPFIIPWNPPHFLITQILKECLENLVFIKTFLNHPWNLIVRPLTNILTLSYPLKWPCHWNKCFHIWKISPSWTSYTRLKWIIYLVYDVQEDDIFHIWKHLFRWHSPFNLALTLPYSWLDIVNLPLKFGQNWVSYSWYIPNMDKCCLNKCQLDIWNLF